MELDNHTGTLGTIIPASVLKNSSQSAGFEPARAEPNRFLVCRLNHSAMTALQF